jgi:hypothetical protein
MGRPTQASARRPGSSPHEGRLWLGRIPSLLTLAGRGYDIACPRPTVRRRPSQRGRSRPTATAEHATGRRRIPARSGPQRSAVRPAPATETSTRPATRPTDCASYSEATRTTCKERRAERPGEGLCEGRRRYMMAVGGFGSNAPAAPLDGGDGDGRLGRSAFHPGQPHCLGCDHAGRRSRDLLFFRTLSAKSTPMERKARAATDLRLTVLRATEPCSRALSIEAASFVLTTTKASEACRTRYVVRVFARPVVLYTDSRRAPWISTGLGSPCPGQFHRPVDQLSPLRSLLFSELSASPCENPARGPDELTTRRSDSPDVSSSPCQIKPSAPKVRPALTRAGRRPWSCFRAPRLGQQRWHPGSRASVRSGRGKARSQ